MTETMKRLTARLWEQQAEGALLGAAIVACLPVRQANLKELRYGG